MRVYNGPQLGGGKYIPMSQWRNMGFDGHSVITNNPMLVNVSGRDFRLQRGSPAIDAGVADPNAPARGLCGYGAPSRAGPLTSARTRYR